MEKSEMELRSLRLQMAVLLCTSEDGDPEVKEKILQALCEVDPVVKQVLKDYEGVKVA